MVPERTRWGHPGHAGYRRLSGPTDLRSRQQKPLPLPYKRQSAPRPNVVAPREEEQRSAVVYAR